jgi:acid phosphatase family membrane protein YuiD
VTASAAEIQQVVFGVVQGLASSTVFILALMIGFCVVVGFTKLKKTAGGGAMVIKSLDEQMTHKPAEYLRPGDPRGPADQLHSPELLEAAARK